MPGPEITNTEGPVLSPSPRSRPGEDWSPVLEFNSWSRKEQNAEHVGAAAGDVGSCCAGPWGTVGSLGHPERVRKWAPSKLGKTLEWPVVDASGVLRHLSLTRGLGVDHY